MTVFADFLDLQTAVIEQVRDPSIADVFPRLVKQAEVTFNRRLRCREQITTAAIVISAGIATLPTDFVKVIGVYDAAGLEYIAQPLQALKVTQSRGYFAISGSNIVTKNDETLSLEYYASVPSITDSLVDTNWLLTKAPGVYLYGVSMEAAKYLRDVDGARAFGQLLEDEFTAVSAQDDDERYSRARVRVRGMTP